MNREERRRNGHVRMPPIHHSWAVGAVQLNDGGYGVALGIGPEGGRARAFLGISTACQLDGLVADLLAFRNVLPEHATDDPPAGGRSNSPSAIKK